jgi:hypothetical protein
VKHAPAILVLLSLLILTSTYLVASSPSSKKPPPGPSGPSLSLGPDDNFQVGARGTFDNVTVFAITAKRQAKLPPMTTLDAAIAKGQAEVRERGAGAGSYERDAPRVNELVIENKGDTAIYVLAGTIVKGGNQDRQIGQDFIVEPRKTAGVDAFCVEHGRWTAEREGQATSGKFGTVAQLVTSKIRAAAQYEKNQSEVWDKVAATNAAHGKSAPSGTLMATIDDPEIARKRASLADKVSTHLEDVEPSHDVVGLAYAIDGKVRSVRWFANHQIFELARPALTNAAAVDALTAKVERNGAAPASTVVDAKAVVDFVQEVQHEQVKEKRDTQAANKNEYRESEKAYGSSTMLKSGFGTGAGGPPAAEAPVSVDFLAK